MTDEYRARKGMARGTVLRWQSLGYFEDGPPEIRTTQAMIEDIERAMAWAVGEKVKRRPNRMPLTVRVIEEAEWLGE